MSIINGTFDIGLDGWAQTVSGNADIMWDTGRARLRIYQCNYAEIKQDVTIDRPILSFDWEQYFELCPERPGAQVIVEGQTVYYRDAYGYWPSYCVYGRRESGIERIDLSAYIGKVATIVFFIHGYPGYCFFWDHTNTYFWVDNVILTETILGDIAFSSDPPRASIILDGTDIDKVTPYTVFNLTVGTHSYTLKLANYYEYSGTVNVVPNHIATVSAVLIPMVGNIYFTTIPPGAEIFIDGMSTVQITPHTITGIIQGDHSYILRLANYNDYTGTVTVVENQTAIVDVTLSLSGNVSFTTTPPGAKIFLGDVDTNQITPYTITGLTPGDHTYILRLANYYDYTGTVTIIGGETASITATLAPLPANVSISSVPTGAKIFFDNIDTGHITQYTVIVATDIANHKIKLTRSGYLDRIISISVSPGQTLYVNAILDPISLLSSIPYWPKFHNDIKNTGSIATAISSTNGSLKWAYSTGGQMIEMPPAIGPYGVIYITVSFSSGAFGLYAINPDGTLKWSSSFLGGNVYTSPTVDKDGTIYFGAYDNNLYAINPDGTLKWKYAINSPFYSTIIGPDGTIYTGSSDKNLYAINPDGTLKWTYITSTGILSAPTIGSDGTIYITNDDGNLYAITDSGDHAILKWIYSTGAWAEMCPAIANDGTIYIGNGNANLYAIIDSGDHATSKWTNPDGTPKPYHAIPADITGQYPWIDSSPTIGPDGTIYVGSGYWDSSVSIGHGYLYAINPDGTLKWYYTLGSSTDSSPSIGPDGIIYIADNSGYLYAIKDNVTSGLLQWSYLTTSTYTASPVISSNGTLYIGGDNGNLYAFQPQIAYIIIDSIPTGAKIFLDGVDTGKITPDTLTIRTMGDYKIKLTYSGYLDRMISISISPEQTLYINAILDPPSILSTAPYWPKFHNDIKNTGSIATVISSTDGTLKWTYYTGGQYIEMPPAIGPDGIIYITSNSYPNFLLYAIYPDGNLKWYFSFSNYIYASSVVDKDGTIYLGVDDYNLYAINPDGTLKWKYNVNGRTFYSAIIGPDGTIYTGSGDANLYAINPDGTLKWIYSTNSNGIYAAPTIGSDGTIYITDDNGNLYAINPDGSLKWIYSTSTGGWIELCPAIDNNGTIYFADAYGDIYAINSDGISKWVNPYHTGGYIDSSPTIGSDGTIYIGSGDGNLYTINPDGTLKWYYTLGSSTDSSPTIGPDGIIYIADNSGYLYAIKDNVTSGLLQWSYLTTSTFTASPAIGSDGTLYIGGDNGNLYAFQSIVGCTTSTKYSGDLLTLKATPIQGVAPYTVEFRRANSQSMVDTIDTVNVDGETYIIPTGRLGGSLNPVLDVPEGTQISRAYNLDITDINDATSKVPGEGASLLFATKMIDSCSPSQLCVKYCKIFVACAVPVCDFVVT